MEAPTTLVGGLIGMDGDNTITYATASMTELTGWTDLVGRDVFDLVHPDDHAESRERIRRAREDGVRTLAFVNRWRHADGGYVTFSWSPVCIDGQWYGHGLPIPDFLHRVEGGMSTGVAGASYIDVTTAGSFPPADPGEKTIMQDPSARIAELERENAALERENSEMRAELRRRDTIVQGGMALFSTYFRDPER